MRRQAGEGEGCTPSTPEQTLDVMGEWRLEERGGGELGGWEGAPGEGSVGGGVVLLVAQLQPQLGRLAQVGERRRGVAEPPVLRQGRNRAEGLAALVALYLHSEEQEVKDELSCVSPSFKQFYPFITPFTNWRQPHSYLQFACILLCRHKLENWV